MTEFHKAVKELNHAIMTELLKCQLILWLSKKLDWRNV